MPEPEGEGAISCGDGSACPMSSCEELGLDEEVCYLDQDMDIGGWAALTGITLERCVINEEVSEKILCLLRPGNRYPIAMDAYGCVVSGDLMK